MSRDTYTLVLWDVDVETLASILNKERLTPSHPDNQEYIEEVTWLWEELNKLMEDVKAGREK